MCDVMKKYIDADALSRYFYENVSLSHWMHSRLNTAEKAMGKTREIIENFPAADVAPVRHGEWVYGENEGQDGWYCSKCHFFIPWYYNWYGLDNIDFIKDFHACPHCSAKMVTYTGAKMDGGTGKGEEQT